MSKRLKAPSGADEVNFGTERFRVDNDGTVTVPDEAAPTLTGVAGFETDDEPVPLPSGMVRMTHEDGGAVVSVAGTSYEAGEDGVFVLPVHAMAHLTAHGFDLAPET